MNETLLQAEPIPESDLFLNLNEENEEEVETLNTISEEVDLFFDEIHEVIDFANNLSFTSVVKLAKSTVNGKDTNESIEFDERNEFCFPHNGEPNYNFYIELGTDKCPRFSCACHKNQLCC